MSALFAVPDRAGDDSAILERGARRAAQLRADGFEPCDECEEWQRVEGSRVWPPMRLVANKRYMCEHCFQAALERASDASAADLLPAAAADHGASPSLSGFALQIRGVA